MRDVWEVLEMLHKFGAWFFYAAIRAGFADSQIAGCIVLDKCFNHAIAPFPRNSGIVSKNGTS